MAVDDDSMCMRVPVAAAGDLDNLNIVGDDMNNLHIISPDASNA